jgi:Trk K+ transport system NAD-binding subunit
VITPSPDDPLEIGDELIFVTAPSQEPSLQAMLGHAPSITP